MNQNKWPCENCSILEDERDGFKLAFKIAIDALSSIMVKGTTEHGNTPEGLLAYEALGKLEKIGYDYGEF